MRWIVLALSLGATIVSMIHGVLAIWQLTSGSGSVMVDGSAFTWTTDILLLSSAVISLIGGILAFTRRRIGGILLIAAALLCIFAHHSTRNYGYVLLVAGAMALFIRPLSTYDYEDEDEGFEEGGEPGYDDEEEYEDRAGRHISSVRAPAGGYESPEELPYAYGGKRKERASRIHLDREEYSLGGDSGSRPGGRNERKDGERKDGEPVRVRSVKVCPACGASVGADHKFCHTCGTLLHGPRVPQEPKEADAETFSVPGVSDVNALDKVQEYLKPADKYEDDFEEETPGDGVQEYSVQEDSVPEDAMHHRVFVKAPDEDEDVFKAPLKVNPDNSYQEFSKYTRRRKRRRNSWVRRILGMLVLFLVVSGAAYLLLGMRTVPEPVPPEREETPIPVPEPAPVIPEPTIWERQQAQIENPTRGVVTGSSVNVRQSNSTASQVVTRLNSGAAAELIERREGTPGTMPLPWFHISIPSNGRDGWIYGQYFQPLDGRPATLPAGYTDALLNTFGAGRAELTAQLGQPARQTPTTLTWDGIAAEARAEGEVTRLQITGAQHVLQNGVAVGIEEDILYRTVGYPSEFRQGQLRYIESGALGMSVRLQSGKVQSITVGNI